MPATADYLAEHPFASPDIINPPEAPTYRYRPDINSIIDLEGVETDNLSAGSRIDILIDNRLLSYVLQDGILTGSSLEVVPDDYDGSLNQQYWLLVAADNSDFIVVTDLGLTFADISGTISLDQLPPGSLATVNSIGENALYFYTDATALPSLVSADEVASFLSLHLSFTDLSGTIGIDQFPPGSVASLDSIDEDGFYFFDNTLFVPKLLGRVDSINFLNLQFTDIGGTLTLAQLPPGTAATVDTIGEDGLFFFDDSAGLPFLISKTDSIAFLLPSQTGNDGKVLQTNAGILSWATAAGGGSWGSITGTLSAQTDLQAVLDAKQPLDSDLTAIAGLTATTDNFIVSVSSAWASRTPSQVRTTLGLVIGTNVQAWDADLDSWAAITRATGFDTFATTPSSANLISLLTDETGTGACVFANTPTLVTPVLGAATGTLIVLSSFFNEAKGADIASATTTDIGAATGNYLVVTGTTTITGLGTVQAGTRRIVQFSGALTLTHNATSPILTGSANITTVAGDTAEFVSLGSGNWICTSYQKVTITGTGGAVQATSPTFVTPVLGTPSSGTLSSCTAATDSVAGVMSAADHTTLTLLSTQLASGTAPTVAKGVLWFAQKTGIDAKTNATTDIFTVPAGNTAVILGSWLIPTTVTAGAALAFVYKIIESGAGNNMTTATAAASTAPATTKTWTQSGAPTGSGGPLNVCATGNKVQCSITTAFTTSTTVTATVVVYGY